MSRPREIIVLDSSSDDDGSESEVELRVAVRSGKGKALPAKKKKKPSADTRVFGDYVLTRDEQYLLAADEEDESDASADEDDDYDDRDDSFGDGARAFARKRRRPTDTRSKLTTKRKKTPTPNRVKPPPSRAPARRAHSDSDSGDVSDDVSVDDDDDGPFRHSNMVRKMEKARAMRTQANGKVAKPKDPPRQVVMHAHKRSDFSGKAGSKQSTATYGTPVAPKKPLAARKSAAKPPVKVVRPVKRSRHDDDSDEYVGAGSSEEESDDASADEDLYESDHLETVRKRPAHRNEVEQIEISDEDSASESDSEEPESEDESPPRHSSTKTAGRGATTHVPAAGRSSKAKPNQTRTVTQTSKLKVAQKTPPPPPAPRSSPPQPPPTTSRQRQEPIPTSRPARAVAALPENMSVEDMQAQERQLAYFKQLQKRKEQSSQPTNTSQQPRGRSTSNSSRSANGARKAVSTQHVYRLPRQESGASVASTVSSAASKGASTTSKEPTLPARTKQLPYYVPPALRDGFSATGTKIVMTTVSVAADASISFAAAEKVDHIPLLHNTSWRERLQFVRAPLNILPSKRGGRSNSAFLLVKERELCEFDDSGLVSSLADITSPPKISTGEVLTQNHESQEAVSIKVRRVIDKSLPVLKQCHQRRVQDIVADMRKSLPWHSPASSGNLDIVETRRQLPRAPQVSASVDLAPIERVHAKRILHASLPRARTKQPNRLVGTVHYILGFPRPQRAENADEGDDAVQEISRFPETIIEFGEDLAPMRQSCAWISVKTNIHVEDDPMLRYIPYLGDKGRVNIDPRRYHSTTLDKDQTIVIELPEGNGSDDEDPVKTQELESWRSDAASLVVATRSATDDEVMEYLLCMVIKECGRSPKVFQALRDIGGFAEPMTDYDVIQKREDTARSINKRVKDLHHCLEGGTSSDIKSAEVRTYVSQLVRKSNVGPDNDSVSHRLRAPLSSFSSNYLQYPDSKGLRPRKSFGHMTEWYRDLFCRRCYTYDCQQHGIQHPQPSQRMDPLNPVVKKSGVGLLRAKKGKGNSGSDVIELDSSSSSSSEDSQVEGDNEDAQSTISGSVDGDDDGANGADRRRSRRSQTRASTLASASLQVQEVMVEKERKKHQRKQAKQLRKLVRQVDDSEYLDDSYRDIVGPTMDNLISPAPDTPCGALCWKRSAPVAAESNNPETEISEVLKVMLRKVIPILGDNACIIARLCHQRGGGAHVDPTDSCAAIHRYIEHEKKKTDGSSLFSSAVYHDRFHDKSEYRRQNNPYRSSAALHSGNREMIKRTRMNRAQQQTKEREHRYEPCNHSGECNDGNCECLKRGHDCDKACSCSRDCANRNHGCTCLPGQCRTKACSCYSAGRECDPDFCFSCGAHEAAVMEFDDRQRGLAASDVGICRNVSLLRGIHKKIGVAFSATHGWGAYALEPIRKGDFVYEYRGALISDDEAERRGNIYDAIKVSYLFDVNSDEVVDAMRKGNKIKFANHRMQEVANLETKILVVRGEHRIALFAKWDLHVGEELFFDYGYTNETAPEWSQLRTPHNPRYADSELEEDDDDELKEVLRLQSRLNGNDDDI